MKADGQSPTPSGSRGVPNSGQGTVNDTFAGFIFQQPWECDVTRLLKIGENQVEVVVVGTLKNLLGPHHFDPPDGMAGDFTQGPDPGPPPGDKHDTIGYGLFEPYVLRQCE
jgi:hypothetical protein